MKNLIIVALAFITGFLLCSHVIIFKHAKDFTINYGNVADWVVALGTFGLFIMAILGFDIWKKQKRPDANVNILRDIGILQTKINNGFYEIERLKNKYDDETKKNKEIKSIHEKICIDIDKSLIDLDGSIMALYFLDEKACLKLRELFQELADIFCTYSDYNYLIRRIGKTHRKSRYMRNDFTFNKDLSSPSYSESHILSETKIIYHYSKLFYKLSFSCIDKMYNTCTNLDPIYGRSYALKKRAK